MRTVMVLALAGAVVAGCSSTPQPVGSPAEQDGRFYSAVAALPSVAGMAPERVVRQARSICRAYGGTANREKVLATLPGLGYSAADASVIERAAVVEFCPQHVNHS